MCCRASTWSMIMANSLIQTKCKSKPLKLAQYFFCFVYLLWPVAGMCATFSILSEFAVVGFKLSEILPRLFQNESIDAQLNVNKWKRQQFFHSQRCNKSICIRLHCIYICELRVKTQIPIPSKFINCCRLASFCRINAVDLSLFSLFSSHSWLIVCIPSTRRHFIYRNVTYCILVIVLPFMFMLS